jgi:hypothetical protein
LYDLFITISSRDDNSKCIRAGDTRAQSNTTTRAKQGSISKLIYWKESKTRAQSGYEFQFEIGIFQKFSRTVNFVKCTGKAGYT